MGWLPEWLGGAPPPPKKKICCACPETKGPRDACVTEHGASGGRVARAPPPLRPAPHSPPPIPPGRDPSHPLALAGPVLGRGRRSLCAARLRSPLARAGGGGAPRTWRARERRGEGDADPIPGRGDAGRAGGEGMPGADREAQGVPSGGGLQRLSVGLECRGVLAASRGRTTRTCNAVYDRMNEFLLFLTLCEFWASGGSEHLVPGAYDR